MAGVQVRGRVALVKYPATVAELQAEGFRFVRTWRCRGESCDTEIFGFLTPGGKIIPLSVVVEEKADDQLHIAWPTGIKDEQGAMRYQPHFIDCVDVQSFR